MKRALLLEDSLTVAAVASKALRAAGYTVVSCASTKGARAACLTQFDLYVVDINVKATAIGGEGDGLAFARTILSSNPDVLVVVWSAGDRRAEAEALGARFALKGEAPVEALLEAIG